MKPKIEQSETFLLSEMNRVVDEVTRDYARRCHWAPVEDLRQEAWVAACAARAGWEPERGSLAGYVAVAARRGIAAWLIRASSPASASWHRRHDLMSAPRASDDASERAFESGDGASWADEILDERRWRVRVLSRLIELVRETGATSVDDLVQAVGKATPKKPIGPGIASELERLAKDETLRQMWAEQVGDSR